MKNKFVYLVTIILAVLYLAAGHYFAVQGLSFFKEKSPTDVVEARVVKLLPAAAAGKTFTGAAGGTAGGRSR